MQLSISTPKAVVLVADGQRRTVTTTAGTAGALLAEQGITLGPDDRTSLLPDQALLNEMRLQVFRVTHQQVVVTSAMPHKTVQTQDPNVFVGQQTVTQPGADGQQATTFRVIVDRRRGDRPRRVTAVVKQAVDQVVPGAPSRQVGSHGADRRARRPPPAAGSTGRRWPSASPAATRARSTPPATTGSTSSRSARGARWAARATRSTPHRPSRPPAPRRCTPGAAPASGAAAATCPIDEARCPHRSQLAAGSCSGPILTGCWALPRSASWPGSSTSGPPSPSGRTSCTTPTRSAGSCGRRAAARGRRPGGRPRPRLAHPRACCPRRRRSPRWRSTRGWPRRCR